MKSRLMLLFTLLSTSILFSAAAQAQDTASLTGSVKDPSGAAVANADVTVASPARGINRTTTTNSDGEYSVPALPPGSYDVSIAAPGFKKYEARGVILRVAQKSRNDVTLQVGAATTSIEVQGTTVAPVETESNEVAGTITGKEISQLQLNGRVFTQLVTLTPGVSDQTGHSEGVYGIYGNTNYSVNGGRLEYNNWELDGGDNMDNGSNATLNVTPSIDAIAEVRVLTSNYGAQYGRNGSGTIETETKSGSNKFHGDAYEFVRNELFNARNYFDPPGPPPAYKKNDFGYTKTHSRPHVSDDNPYSESQFRTMKYRPEFPDRFGCIQDRRAFCQSFFRWYNEEYRHSGVGLLPPAMVHYGQAENFLRQRQDVLDVAYQRHPERFVRSAPKPPALPSEVWINKPVSTAEPLTMGG